MTASAAAYRATMVTLVNFATGNFVFKLIEIH